MPERVHSSEGLGRIRPQLAGSWTDAHEAQVGDSQCLGHERTSRHDRGVLFATVWDTLHQQQAVAAIGAEKFGSASSKALWR